MEQLIVLCVLLVIAWVFLGSFKQSGKLLGLIICTFGIEQVLVANSEFFGSHGTLLNLFVVFAIGCVLLWLLGSGGYRFRGLVQPSQCCALAFTLLFIASAEWSPIGSSEDLLARFGPYLLVYVVAAPLLLQQPEDGVVGLRTMLWLSVGICAYVLADRSVWEADGERLALRVIGGSIKVSNPLAMSDIGALAFIASCLWRVSDTSPRVLGWARYVFMAVALYVAARSSRGETAGAVVSVGIVLLLSRTRAGSNRLGRGVGGVAGVLLVAGTALVVLSQVLGTATGERYSSHRLSTDVDGRLEVVSIIWRVFSADPDNWLFGLGADYSTYVSGAYPHNEAFQALTETGVFGLTLWFGIWLFGIGRLIRAWQLAKARPEYLFAAECLLAIVLYFMFVGLKRGHVLDAVALMTPLLAERFALSLRERAAHAAGVSESLAEQPLLAPARSLAR